jgi:hypothetical protein
VVQALTDVTALAEAVRGRRQFLDRQAGRAQKVATDGLAVEATIEDLEHQVDVHAKTAALLTSIGEQAQESAREQFEALATQGLQYIFGGEYSFRFEAGESGGQATLEPLIRSEHDGRVIETTVTDARGGGYAQVTGFVLRLVMVKLSPKARDLLALDESFSMVAQSLEPRVAGFLREAARRLGMQIILVTHSAVYADYADARYRLVLGRDGVTQVFEGESE